MKKAIPTIILVILLIAFLNTSHVALASNDKPLVVCTTSVLASIVRDLAGESVDVKYIVSPSLCPGHYDVKPGDVETIKSADLILAHGMEWKFGWLKSLVEAANQTGELKAYIANVTGAWNTPPALRSMYEKVASLLFEALGLNVSANLSKCLSAIDNVEAELRNIARENEFNETPVACMLWQESFVEYLGFDVVASYGPPEKLSVKDIENVEKNITEREAKLVIDNMHSGVDIGEKISEDTGAIHVILINFPESVVGVSNITDMMLYNARILADSLKYYEYKAEIDVYKADVNLWRGATIGVTLLAIVEGIALVLLVRRRISG